MYKALLWTFFIVAIALVVNKEYFEQQKSDLNHLYEKVSYEISVMKKVPADTIYYSSEFQKNLNMNEVDVDTLALKLRKDLNLEFKIEDFRKSKDVGSAIDFLRLALESKKKVELDAKQTQNATN